MLNIKNKVALSLYRLITFVVDRILFFFFFKEKWIGAASLVTANCYTIYIDVSAYVNICAHIYGMKSEFFILFLVL